MSEISFVPVNEPLLDGNESKYLQECINSGWISSEGPFVNEFESKFSSSVGRQYGIAVTNGTAAIDVAIELLGVGPDDEVIIPAFTIISCVLQIVRSGATPVLVDSDPVTWNMDASQLERKITKKTKAIMMVHIYGLPADVDTIMEIATQHSIPVIEDAAEMHGQMYKGRPCGSFGDISTFSFYPNKHITTGEGGMLVCDNEEYYGAARSLRNLCFQPEQRFVHKRLGWNLRMTNMQAAIGLAQLERIEEFVERKRKMGRMYTALLSDIPNLSMPLPKVDFAENIYWVFGVVLGEAHELNAKECIAELSREGVGSRPFFCPMHRQPALQDMGYFPNERYPVAERLYERGLYLPSGMAITPQQIEFCAAALKKVLG